MRTVGCGWFLTAVLIVGLGGCGTHKSNLPDLVPVQGTVTIDEKPLSGTVVTFIPSGATRGAGGAGYTDTDGKYELRYQAGQKGTAAGEYRVVLAKFVMPDGSDLPPNSSVGPMDSPAKQVLPIRYSDAEQTTLTASVAPAGGTVDFHLKSKP
jgi:hypothetical protein